MFVALSLPGLFYRKYQVWLGRGERGRGGGGVNVYFRRNYYNITNDRLNSSQ